MNWRETWPSWQPQPGAEDPSRGGMSQLAAYGAGLTDNPGCWVQPIDIRDPRLNPESPEYDWEYAAEAAWEDRGLDPASPDYDPELAAEHSRAKCEARAQAEPPEPGTEPQAVPEPELPF